MEYQIIMNNNARNAMQESKDVLYHKFKKESESVLNKEFIKKYEDLGETAFEEV
jgi:hypothetical protein